MFIEHDLAKPIVITAAEVIHYGADIRNDMAYFLPQNKILQGELDKLVEKVGIILQNEHVVGYFGIDVVTFQDQFDVGIYYIYIYINIHARAHIHTHTTTTSV